jgi:hypothetical protein
MAAIVDVVSAIGQSKGTFTNQVSYNLIIFSGATEVALLQASVPMTIPRVGEFVEFRANGGGTISGTVKSVLTLYADAGTSLNCTTTVLIS